MLTELEVKDAMLHRLHDFRRGHAEDLWVKGGRLYDILLAGDWKSASFMSYLSRMRLECDAVADAHGGQSRLPELVESDDDDMCFN